MSTARSKLERLKDAVEEDVAWSVGSEHPWQGGALVSPWLLESLCILASQAHETSIRDFLKKIKETDE